MQLSIITINYNNSVGLLRTLQSVGGQQWKNFEHIVIDGSSKDQSIEILKSQTYINLNWISEPDNGIYDAMNKGIAKATGDYLLFLNSGDTLNGDCVLQKVALHLNSNIDIVYGNLQMVPEKGPRFTNIYPEKIDFSFLKRTSLGHASTFIKKELFEIYGHYRIDLKIVSDWAFFVKVLMIHKVSHLKLDITVATFYEGGISTSGTTTKLHKAERKKVLLENFDFYNEEMDAYIAQQEQRNHLFNLINDNISLVSTNRFFLKIVNSIISVLGGILKIKRSRFKY